jgi:Fur family zinc uptake transcriptional regulator
MTTTASTKTSSKRSAKQAISSATKWCEESGIRFTPLRQRVFEIIQKSKKPIKAYDVLSALSSEDESAKPPTVYRSLEFLLEHHLIHRIETQNAFVACTDPSLNHHCYFLTCSECNAVEEMRSQSLQRNLAQCATHHGFKTSHSIVEWVGSCRSCQKKQKHSA